MKPASYQREQVVNIINSVIGRIHSPSELSREALSHELNDLKNIIENLRNELHAAQPSDINTTHIPSATDELDAVVGTTEKATDEIMDSCENILNIMKDADPELFGQVEGNIVKIFETCTFQDITGQRIKKVVRSLKLIDEKTKSVLAAIEGQLVDPDHKNPVGDEVKSPLLNGPALPGQAVSQEEIDRLLAEFDNPGGA